MAKDFLKVNIVLNETNRSWIIEKIANKLCDHVGRLGDDAVMTNNPLEHADVVHHMSWAFARRKTATPSTMFITHLDDIFKMNEVKDTLAGMVDVGVCMSRDMRDQLTRHGVPGTSLTYVNPAHEGVPSVRRTVVGLTTRVYQDGRKREGVLLEVAQRMPLDGFEFRIFGNGWDAAIRELRQAGAEVRYWPESGDFHGDYVTILEALPQFDYYLYLGMDEGSLGTLDALAAGVPTIVTPQGFHLDAPSGITHAVITPDDLERVFRGIDDARRLRQASVADWTWTTYAQRHKAIWLAILKGYPLPQDVIATLDMDIGQTRDFHRRAMYRNALSPRRMLSALSHTPVFSSLRDTIKGLGRAS